MRKIHAFPFISAMLLLSACSSPGLKEGGPADNSRGRPEPHPTCCMNPDAQRKEHDDPASILAKRSIYFDFDQYVIKDEFRPLVEAHAKYLANHRDIKVYVIGNTDAHGGREYNVALGQRRAESVHKVFSLYGVGENQIEAISYGAEQPKAEGNDETAWAENRRVDIKYFSRDQQQTQQAAEQEYREPPLPTLLRLRDCAERDAVLTTQQQQLNGEEAALRAEETRLAARERAIQAMRSNGNTESLTQAERDWNHASAQLKKKIDNFDHLSAPYRAGVLYLVQHCAFSQVRRQDLQQLCQEGTYTRFCAKYQAFQTDE